MLNEQIHAGGVKSRTHETCLVQDPVRVVIEGKATDLSLVDAKLLLAGLGEAVARVEPSEAKLMGDGLNYNIAVIGKARAGMSRFPLSLLGDVRGAARIIVMLDVGPAGWGLVDSHRHAIRVVQKKCAQLDRLR